MMSNCEDGSHQITPATLIMEPVINFVPGPSDFTFGFYAPEEVNPAGGYHPFQANQPGEFDTYAAGNPPDALLDELSINNNTHYDITSLTLQIIGTANDVIPGVSWTITRDPNVNAVFGDANGDGKVGISDIFKKITVSDDGKTITLSDGIIPVNSLFTDRIFAFTADGSSVKVGIDGSFDGILVPPG